MCSISLIKWVEIIAVDSSGIFSIINFNISFLVIISTPAIGSSNIYIFASLDSINIKFNFSIFPLDKFLMWLAPEKKELWSLMIDLICEPQYNRGAPSRRAQNIYIELAKKREEIQKNKGNE